MTNTIRTLVKIIGCLAVLVAICPQSNAENFSEPDLETVVQQRAFQFFWNESDLKTGLTKDRANNFHADSNTVASTASTGYALSSIPIGISHHWITRKQGYARALLTLRFIHDSLPNNHGWYFHFVDMHAGARVWKCELSSIDTGLLLLGVIDTGEYFPGTEVSKLSKDIVERTDFPWMQTRGGTEPKSVFLCMGWKPESGWLPNQWDTWSECPLLYILAMGSSKHPITNIAWKSVSLPVSKVEGFDVIGGPGPLFEWQMCADYFDFRNKRDSHGLDFWMNSVHAHLANHAFCVRNPGKSKTYSDLIWGISANDQPPPRGYGADSDTEVGSVGTVSPSASVTSILFTPELGRKSLAALYSNYRDSIWGRYGFSNAFNVDAKWFDHDVIGIDLGMTLLALENARNGSVWKLTAKSETVQRGMAAAGFHDTVERTPRGLLAGG